MSHISQQIAPSTIHILGVGNVGSSFLELLNSNNYKLTGASDSKSTLYDSTGLDIDNILNIKRKNKYKLSTYKNAEYISDNSYDFINHSDIVIDATPTDLKNARTSLMRSREILKRGSYLIWAAKDALSYGADELIEEFPDKIGLNAVIGGTGLNLVKNLQELKNNCQDISIVGNATTTAIIKQIEQGLSLQEGIARARKLGLLEADPTFDFDGTDAAIKLAIVAKIVFGLKILPENIKRDHIESLNPNLLQKRKEEGKTTRLVGRVDRFGSINVKYEEIDLYSPLNTTPESVAYQYNLSGNKKIVYLGKGLGPVGTAKAIFEDLSFLCPIKEV
ncbi:hypothetical protein [Fluviispira sanaruensis]|uniref:homoserine dehydrogenase n=1 Tax=Fluviispira sanaruensis TaxID=2493639 RepID=A0A4P2VPY2_FLUSA|nr:hypothetical protein [Fluviispira sanaruensis]BBH53949.1 homoserine dehydrogenase [Fluviispira sanaruensis]